MVHALVANSSHPLSRALSQHLKGLNYSVNQFEEVANKGLQAVVKGVPLRIGSAEWVGSALPVAETHGSLVYVQIANQVKGYFSIRKQYRIGLEEMFAKLSPKFGLQVLSGDNDRERNFLVKTYGVSDLFFAQSPFDKLHHVKHQQDQGKQVLMVGDGLNDAGALKQADIGFSVVEDVHGFSPSCDGILEADALAALPRLMQFSKACIRVVKWSFLVSFLYNFIGVSMAVQGLISPLFAAILMPLSSITIIAFSTLGTGWMAHRNGFK
jgi:Cu+-exporting ATPase